MTEKVRILIVDDHPIFLDGLCAVLPFRDEDLEIVGTATNGEEAIRLCRELDPDIMLLDIRMPGMSGVEVARAVLSERPATRIIVLTTFDDRELIVDAMKAGVKGFFLKDTPTVQIIQGIRSVHEGSVLLSDAAAAKLSWEQEQPVVPEHTEVASMSSRQVDILRLMAEGKDNRDIAGQLRISEKTVRNYVSEIYDILGVHHRTQAVLWALNHGLADS